MNGRERWARATGRRRRRLRRVRAKDLPNIFWPRRLFYQYGRRRGLPES